MGDGDGNGSGSGNVIDDSDGKNGDILGFVSICIGLHWRTICAWDCAWHGLVGSSARKLMYSALSELDQGSPYESRRGGKSLTRPRSRKSTILL